ncbi:MAG: DUF1643 domain-containing protein [Synechococcaceae cyanobacterium]
MRFPIAPCAASRGPADRHSLPELAPGAAPAVGFATAAIEGAAAFSPCGRYRWWLRRRWAPAAAQLVFVGLNPSRADGGRDDPTLRRLVGFARAWGYGGLEVLNLFARISVRPVALRRCPDPVGDRCDAWIRRRLRRLAAREAGGSVWLGWGNGGGWRGRDVVVLQLLAAEGWAPLCLGRTGSGQPRHPLYLPRGGSLQPYAPSCGGPSGCSSPLPPWPAFPVATPST